MATKTAEKTTTAAPKEAPTGNLPAAKQKPLIVQFREYVQLRMTTLEDALPPTIPPKRFVSVLMTALQTKPDLLKCTFPSLWNACIRAAQDGLLPDGREGAIAPYGESEGGKRVAEIATWMPMIAGWRKKVSEAGGVKTWRVECVFEKDEFDYDLAEQKIFKHQRPLGMVDPGNVVGAYSVAKLANDETVLEVMSAFQIAQVRSKSKASNGPWSVKEFFPEMCKKTVARRHYKQLPHSESMDDMIARDDQENGFADPEATPIARPERRQLSPVSVMDQYAGDGEVIDNDTGEVTERGEPAKTEVKTETKPATETAKAASAEGGTADDKASPGGGAKEVGATGDATTGASASAGLTGASAEGAAGSLAGSDEMPDEPETSDGADRPWPPGTLPTDVGEYERYLKAKLAEITDASKVAPFFNSGEEKELRIKCETGPRFKELQDLAIARRKELTPANERR